MMTNLIVEGKEVEKGLDAKFLAFEVRLKVLRRENELEQFGDDGIFYFLFCGGFLLPAFEYHYCR